MDPSHGDSVMKGVGELLPRESGQPESCRGQMWGEGGNASRRTVAPLLPVWELGRARLLCLPDYFFPNSSEWQGASFPRILKCSKLLRGLYPASLSPEDALTKAHRN